LPEHLTLNGQRSRLASHKRIEDLPLAELASSRACSTAQVVFKTAEKGRAYYAGGGKKG